MKKALRIVINYYKETDKILWVLVSAASLYGLLLIYSATLRLNSSRQVLVQLLAILIGMSIAIIISKIDFEIISFLWKVLTPLAVLFVLLTFFIGVQHGSAVDKAWIMLPGGMSIQPSEFLKIAFIITFARHLNHVHDNLNSPLNLILLCLHGAAPVLLIHFQGDDGTALIFALIFIGLMFAAGAKARYFVITVVSVAVSLPVAWFSGIIADHQKQRILSIFNPELDITGVGWQQWQARIAIGSGRFFGRGLFNGPRTQNGFVPENYNDFIFSVAGEELGFLGTLAILIILAAIMLRILRTASNARDREGSFICIGVFYMIFFQTIINIGMNISLMPVIGITLPLFSAGGTSTLAMLMALGLVLSVYSHSRPKTFADNYL